MLSYHATHVHEREKREYRDFISRTIREESLPDYVYHFDSAWRDKIENPSAQDFTLNLKEPITHVSSIMMQSIRLPNLVNVIRPSRNTFQFQELDQSNLITTVTIPSGQYNVDDLLSTLMSSVAKQSRPVMTENGIDDNVPFFMSYRFDSSTNDIQLINWRFTPLPSNAFTSTANSSIVSFTFTMVDVSLTSTLNKGDSILLLYTALDVLNNNTYTILDIDRSNHSFTFDTSIINIDSLLNNSGGIGSAAQCGFEYPIKLIYTPSSFLPLLGYPAHDSAEKVNSVQYLKCIVEAITNEVEDEDGDVFDEHCSYARNTIYISFAKEDMSEETISILSFAKFLYSQDKTYEIKSIEVNGSSDNNRSKVTLKTNFEGDVGQYLLTDLLFLKLDLPAYQTPPLTLMEDDVITLTSKSNVIFTSEVRLLQNSSNGNTCCWTQIHHSSPYPWLSFLAPNSDLFISWSTTNKGVIGFRKRQTNFPSYFLVALLNPLYLNILLPELKDESQNTDNPEQPSASTLLTVKLDSTPDSFIFIDQTTQIFRITKQEKYYPTLTQLRMTAEFPNTENLNFKNFDYSGTLVFKRHRKCPM